MNAQNSQYVTDFIVCNHLDLILYFCKKKYNTCQDQKFMILPSLVVELSV